MTFPPKTRFVTSVHQKPNVFLATFFICDFQCLLNVAVGLVAAIFFPPERNIQLPTGKQQNYPQKMQIIHRFSNEILCLIFYYYMTKKKENKIKKCFNDGAINIFNNTSLNSMRLYDIFFLIHRGLSGPGDFYRGFITFKIININSPFHVRVKDVKKKVVRCKCIISV